MKKMVFTVILLVIFVSLFACSKENSRKHIDSSVSAASATPTAVISSTPYKDTTVSPVVTVNATVSPQTTHITHTEEVTPTCDTKPTVKSSNTPVTTLVTELTPTPKRPDYSIDFTTNGSGVNNVTLPNDKTYIEHVSEGLKITGTVDPYIVWMPEISEIDPTEYKYLALRVKVTRYDVRGEIRFGTKSDNRAWSCVSFTYDYTTDWQTVVVPFQDAAFTTDITLDGSPLTILRFDSLDDHDKNGQVLHENDACIIQSIGFFKTAREAIDFEGLYVK